VEYHAADREGDDLGGENKVWGGTSRELLAVGKKNGSVGNLLAAELARSGTFLTLGAKKSVERRSPVEKEKRSASIKKRRALSGVNESRWEGKAGTCSWARLSRGTQKRFSSPNEN